MVRFIAVEASGILPVRPCIRVLAQPMQWLIVVHTVIDGKHNEGPIDEDGVGQVLGYAYTQAVGVSDITDAGSRGYGRISANQGLVVIDLTIGTIKD